MKTLLIITSIFLFSVHAYPQTKPDIKSLHSADWNRCVGCTSTGQTRYLKAYLSERSFGKTLLRKCEEYLKPDSRLRTALKLNCVNGAGLKEKHTLNSIAESTKSKFYFKMVKGEWNSGRKADLSSAPTYSINSVLCLIRNKEDEKNGKSHWVFAFDDFRFSN